MDSSNPTLDTVLLSVGGPWAPPLQSGTIASSFRTSYIRKKKSNPVKAWLFFKSSVDVLALFFAYRDFLMLVDKAMWMIKKTKTFSWQILKKKKKLIYFPKF